MHNLHWSRRQALTHVLAGTAALAGEPRIATAADAAPYPSRPIMLLVGYPPGGLTDILFRALAVEVGKKLGQPMVAENRPGAAGVREYLALKAAAPDGYTLGGTNVALWRQPILEDVHYEPLQDFSYIINIAEVVFAVVVSADSPFRTWADLLAYGRANPEKINFGAAPGLRQSSHLFMLDVLRQEKVDWQAIGHNGGSGGINDVMGGHLTFSVEPVPGASALAHAGKIRLLAVASEQRMKAWPDVPTMKELGYNLKVDSPIGIGGPAHLPAPLVRTLHDVFKQAMEEPAMQAVCAQTDQTPRYMGTAELTRYVAKSEADQRALLTRYGFARKPG